MLGMEPIDVTLDARGTQVWPRALTSGSEPHLPLSCRDPSQMIFGPYSSFFPYTMVTVSAMPTYSVDDVPETDEPRTACAGLREDLKQCLVDSDCVRKV